MAEPVKIDVQQQAIVMKMIEAMRALNLDPTKTHCEVSFSGDSKVSVGMLGDIVFAGGGNLRGFKKALRDGGLKDEKALGANFEGNTHQLNEVLDGIIAAANRQEPDQRQKQLER